LAIAVREYARRGWKFFIVGIAGFVVNQGGLMFLVSIAGLRPWVAGLIAIEISIVANWAINDSWTWRDRRTNPWFIRLGKYNIAAGFTAFGVNYPILLLLSGPAGINYAIANIVGIGLASTVNFLLNHHWTYREEKAEG